MNIQLDHLLERKVSRREFLAYIGAAILAVTGITALLKSLGQTQKSSLGYGSGPYGGKK